jgi:hypothetical protein
LRNVVSNVFEAGLEALRFAKGDPQTAYWEVLARKHELAPDRQALEVDRLSSRVEARTASVLAAQAARLATASLADIARVPEEPVQIAFAAGD